MNTASTTVMTSSRRSHRLTSLLTAVALMAALSPISVASADPLSPIDSTPTDVTSTVDSASTDATPKSVVLFTAGTLKLRQGFYGVVSCDGWGTYTSDIANYYLHGDPPVSLAAGKTTATFSYCTGNSMPLMPSYTLTAHGSITLAGRDCTFDLLNVTAYGAYVTIECPDGMSGIGYGRIVENEPSTSLYPTYSTSYGTLAMQVTLTDQL